MVPVGFFEAHSLEVERAQCAKPLQQILQRGQLRAGQVGHRGRQRGVVGAARGDAAISARSAGSVPSCGAVRGGAGAACEVSASTIISSTAWLGSASLLEITATRRPISGNQSSSLLNPFDPAVMPDAPLAGEPVDHQAEAVGSLAQPGRHDRGDHLLERSRAHCTPAGQRDLPAKEVAAVEASAPAEKGTGHVEGSGVAQRPVLDVENVPAGAVGDNPDAVS
jgi:hypothetical protein